MWPSGQGRDFTVKEHEIGQVKDFIRMVFYNGTITESYVETRMRIYKNQKVTSAIPPDPDSEAIMRVNYHVFHWLSSSKIMMPGVSFETNGWRWVQMKISLYLFGSK